MTTAAAQPAGATPAYFDRANPALLNRITADAACVLEIGCGAGALGAAYKRINPDCHYVGVELFADAAALARERLDEVHVLDVEAAPLPLGPERRADVLIYGDVLEHLRDPAAVLRHHLEHLAEDGLLLCCIPNVQHWTAIRHLLNGRWPAEDEGLFDRTHLRWFTRDSMVAMLRDLGLTIVDVTPRVFDRPAFDVFLAKLRPALLNLGIDEASFAERAAALQFVIRATKRPPRPLFIHASMLRPAAGVNDVRITKPLSCLMTRPGIIARAEVQRLPDAAGLPPDAPRLCILQRPLMTYASHIAPLRRLLDQGLVTVVEFDDHPIRFPAIAEHRHLTFTGAMAVQTSTEPLAGVLRHYNPEVAVFPNTIHSLPEPQNFRTPERLSLFFGALNREADWPPYMAAINEVAAEFGERLSFEVVHDRSFFEALATPHKRFTPTCDYAAYQALLARAEILFAPLADNAFNRMKSDLKFVEAGAHRLAVLASPVVYAATIADGDTGLLCGDAETLARQLRRLVAAPNEARALGERARAWVRANRLMKAQMAAREAWYRSLWARRAELTASMLDRVPELRRA